MRNPSHVGIIIIIDYNQGVLCYTIIYAVSCIQISKVELLLMFVCFLFCLVSSLFSYKWIHTYKYN